MVRTWKDRIATVRITFLTPSVFRFVMVPEMTAKSHRQTVVEDVPESEFETKMQNLQKMKICIYMKQIS